MTFCLHIPYGSCHITGQSWVIVAEIVWLSKAKIFSICHFAERVWWPLLLKQENPGRCLYISFLELKLPGIHSFDGKKPDEWSHKATEYCFLIDFWYIFKGQRWTNAKGEKWNLEYFTWILYPKRMNRGRIFGLKGKATEASRESLMS